MRREKITLTKRERRKEEKSFEAHRHIWKKGSGKTTFARMLCDLIGNAALINFADECKEEVAFAVRKPVEHIEQNKAQFRPILQWWGTEFRRAQDENYWVKKLHWKALAKREKFIVVGDVRFENEAGYLKLNGGLIIRIERGSSDPDQHSSETSLDDFKFDAIVKNDKSLSMLQMEAQQLIGKLGLNK